MSKILILTYLPLNENIILHSDCKWHPEKYQPVLNVVYSNLALTEGFFFFSFSLTLLEDRMERVKTVSSIQKPGTSTDRWAGKATLPLPENQTTPQISELAGNQEVTESNLQFSSGPLQMKTRWRVPWTTFKLNVSSIWGNVKHYKLFPVFSTSPSRPTWNSYTHSRSQKRGMAGYLLGNSSIFMALVSMF